MNIPDKPNFGNALLPAIVQDYFTRNVLMLGYMNEAAWDRTIETGQVTFFSRSRQKLWTKGETSGNFLSLKNIETDCDSDTILIQAVPAGPVCHTGNATCFNDKNQAADLTFLEKVIHERYEHPSDTSYTSQLFKAGINKVAQKVGEEAVELVIESKDENKELFLNEAADLMYHYLVLLKAKGFHLGDVVEVLQERHK